MKILHHILVFVLLIAFGALYAGATGCSVGLTPVPGGDSGDLGDGADGDGTGGGGDDGGGTLLAAKSLAVAAAPGSGEVVLTWAADPDALSYDVYILPIDAADAAEITAITEIYNANTGEFDLEELFSDIDMTIENVADVTYTHAGATNGQAYCYVVTPHQDASASVSASLDMPEFAISVDALNTPDCAMPLERPAITPAPDSTRVGLNWSDVGADGYRVRRGDELCGNFAELVDTIDLAADDIERTNGVTYCYGVDPYWDNYFSVQKIVVGDEETAMPEITLAQRNPDVFGDGDLNVAGVAGFTHSAVFGDSYDNEILATTSNDAFIRSYDKDANEVWTYNTTGDDLRIAHDADLERVVYTYDSGGDIEISYLEVNETTGAFEGAGAWSQSVDPGMAYSLKMSSDGDYIVAGFASGANDDLAVWKQSSVNGFDVDFASYDDGGGDEVAFDVIELDDNSIIAVGRHTPIVGGGDEAIAVKFDSDYNFVSQLDLGGESATKVLQGTDGVMVALVDDNDLVRFDSNLAAVISTSAVPGAMDPVVYDTYIDSTNRAIAVGRTTHCEMFACWSLATIWSMELSGINYVQDIQTVSSVAHTRYLSIAETDRNSLIVSGLDDVDAFAVEF